MLIVTAIENSTVVVIVSVKGLRVVININDAIVSCACIDNRKGLIDADINVKAKPNSIVDSNNNNNNAIQIDNQSMLNQYYKNKKTFR